MMWLKAAFLVAAPFCLALGLTLPLVRFETLYFLSDTPSLVAIVISLWRDGDVVLALAVALFSMVLPVVKLIMLAGEFVAAEPMRQGGLLHRLLPHLSRWSMMDVMLVALVIFAAKSSGLASAFTQPGLWFYAVSAIIAGILPSMASK